MSTSNEGMSAGAVKGCRVRMLTSGAYFQAGDILTLLPAAPEMFRVGLFGADLDGDFWAQKVGSDSPICVGKPLVNFELCDEEARRHG